jgi:hypothetical protein
MVFVLGGLIVGLAVAAIGWDLAGQPMPRRLYRRLMRRRGHRRHHPRV